MTEDLDRVVSLTRCVAGLGEEMKPVKAGTLLAKRAAEVFEAIMDLDRPALGQPKPRDHAGAVSVLDLEEFRSIKDKASLGESPSTGA